ncbi:unnamed protein product [Sphagnum tenellum]
MDTNEPNLNVHATSHVAHHVASGQAAAGSSGSGAARDGDDGWDSTDEWMKNLLGDEPELDAGKHLKEKQTGGKRKGRRGSGKQRSRLAKDSTRAWFVQHLQESFDTLQKEIANVRQSAADDQEGVLSRLKEQSDLMLRKLLQAKDPLQPLPDIVERPSPPTKAQKEAYLREKQETASRKRPPQGTPPEQ